MIDYVFRGVSEVDGGNKAQVDIPEVVAREFADVIKVIKDLLNDGEVATVDKKFQSLSIVGIRLFSTSAKAIALLHEEVSSSDSSLEPDIEGIKEINGRSYKQIVDIFEIYCMTAELSYS